MNHDDLLDMIRRLLALGRSPNEHEAKAAIAKAQELLLRHGLDLKEIEAAAAEKDWQEPAVWSGGSRVPGEIPFVCDIVQTFFFVQVSSARAVRGRSARIYVFGRPHHVAIAAHVFAFLHRTFHALWLEFRRTHARMTPAGSRGTARVFYCGLRDGFAERLREGRREEFPILSERRALVEFKGQVAREFDRRHPNLPTRRRAKLPFQPYAYDIGRQRGREIALHDAVPSQAASPALPSPGKECVQ